MRILEILFIILIISFVGYIFGREIYKKKNNLPSGECSCCQSSSKRLVKNYYKKYGKDRN